MKKLVTISREYGSGGRIIGKLLAEKLDVPFYDKEIIEIAAKESGFSKELMEESELKAKNSFAYSLSSMSSFGEGIGANMLSVNERMFIAQFQVIREIGEKGEAVIVGRCADYVLKDFPGVTNAFIYGEYDDRVKRATRYLLMIRLVPITIIIKPEENGGTIEIIIYPLTAVILTKMKQLAL